ncbi:MAG: metalloprotease [Lacipirellulaceae bacterium]
MPVGHSPSTPVAASPSWSAPFGVWGGVPVRLHLSLVATLVVGGWWATETQSYSLAAALVVLIASLVAHEGAHALAALRVGGKIDGVVLCPLGSLRHPRLPDDPESRVFVAMAGPMANLLLVVAGAVCLAGYDEPGLAELFFPRLDTLVSGAALGSSPVSADPGAAATAFATTFAKLLVWVNWPLFALNLLPATPFDGGRALGGLLAPWVGNFLAAQVVGRLAVATGVLLGASAVLIEADPTGAPPADLALALVGMLVAFGGIYDLSHAGNGGGATQHGWRIREADDAIDDDWWASSDEDAVVLVEASLAAEEQATRATPTDVDEGSEESRLDAVLAKLHTAGLTALSPDERAVLDRASRRFRMRRGRE